MAPSRGSIGHILKPEAINSRWRLPKPDVHISHLYEDSKEISTAICIFMGSGNSMALSRTLYLETGSPKFNMAAVKPEVPLSQLLYKIAKKFQPLFACFWGQGTQ
jgi:hypothetical protein